MLLAICLFLNFIQIHDFLISLPPAPVLIPQLCIWDENFQREKETDLRYMTQVPGAGV